MSIRVTRVAAQVGGTTGPSIRVTRIAAQVAGTVTVDLRVSRVGAEIAGLPVASDLRVTDMILQVATTETYRERYWTSQLGTTDSILVGATMALGVDEYPAAAEAGSIDRTAADTISVGESAVYQQFIFEVTASDTITVTESNTYDYFTPLSASDTITVSESNAYSGSFSRVASDSVSITEVDEVAGPVPVTAEDSVTVTDVAHSNLITRTGSDTITIGETNHIAAIVELTRTEYVSISEGVNPGLLYRTGSDSLTIAEEAQEGFVASDATVVTASDTITFTETNNRFVLKASAIALTVTDTITIIEHAIFPIFLTVSETVTIIEDAVADHGWKASDTIEITEESVVNFIRGITASDTLVVGQSFTYTHLDASGNPVSRSGPCNIKQQYSPLVGAGSPENPTPPRTVVPPLEKKDEVILFYPTTGPICSATMSVTLRTPNFGDRDRTSVNRINRESRGGSLTIFRDPKWPEQRSLVMDFTGVKEEEVADIFTFLDSTLGQLVGFRDWMGRLWYGIITNPATPIIRTNKWGNDIALELEVEGTFAYGDGCDTLVITESAVVEVV